MLCARKICALMQKRTDSFALNCHPLKTAYPLGMFLRYPIRNCSFPPTSGLLPIWEVMIALCWALDALGENSSSLEDRDVPLKNGRVTYQKRVSRTGGQIKFCSIQDLWGAFKLFCCKYCLWFWWVCALVCPSVSITGKISAYAFQELFPSWFSLILGF